MDPRNKTLILIVIFFILGVAVGYVSYQPKTIEKIVEKIVTVTITVTPTPTPTPTQTPTPTPAPTPTVANFSVRIYNPSTDTPTKTIELTNWRANPSEISIRPGDTVVIKITDYTLSLPLNLFMDSEKRYLGTGGAVFITFNNKGKYTFKAISSSSDPNILPQTYAEGSITVY